MRKIKQIIIHHSLTDDCEKLSWGSIRNYHKTLGWRDIGYHYGIEKIRGGYEILKGRSILDSGAHTKGQNANSIGICCVGNFDKTKVPKGVIDKLVFLLKELMVTHKIKKENIFGHNHYADYKSCPGTKFDVEYIKGLL
jgi:hypothetical protein